MRPIEKSLVKLVVFAVATLSLFVWADNAEAQDFLKCEQAIDNSLSILKQVASFAGSLNDNQCLNREGLLESTPRFMSHTLSDIGNPAAWAIERPIDSFALKSRLGIGGGLELLSYRIELVQFLVSVMLTSNERGDSQAPIDLDAFFDLESQEEQQAWLQTYGGFAAIVIKADLLAGLLPQLVQNVLTSDFDFPTDEDVTIIFSLGNESAIVDIESVFDSTLYLNRDDGQRIIELFNIDQVTVKISQGPLDGSAEFDPTDWSLQRGEIGLNLDLGPNTITSRTVFSKGHGVERQILQLTAQLGNVDLLGEATFQENSQEFKLQANVSDLLTVSTLTQFTPQGFSSPSVGFLFSIPIEKQD